MTRLPSTAFLPSGAFDSDMSLSLDGSSFHGLDHDHHHKRLNGNANDSFDRLSCRNFSSVIPPPSASSLPRTTSNYPLLADISSPSLQSLPSLSNSESIPFSLSSIPAPQPQNSRLPSHLQFQAFPSDPSTSSLSPTLIGPSGHRLPPPTSITATSKPTPPHLPPGVVGSLPRSVSVDAAASSHLSAQIVQRLNQQNALVREAWEAERNYLEANRRRIEEVYQEERIIMDQVCSAWETEKAEMAAEIQSLKQQIQRLEGENSTLKAVTAQSIRAAGLTSPYSAQQVMSPAPSSLSRPQNPTASTAGVSARPNAISPPGGTSVPHGPGGGGVRWLPQHLVGGSSHTSPTGIPGPQNPAPKDILASPDDASDAPVPIIDVHEIDSRLEGIPIKATAIQKPTFESAGSPPPPQHDGSQTPPSNACCLPGSTDEDHGTTKHRTRFQTMEALAAPESKRLTMHAGHTPNLSLSIVPSAKMTDEDEDTSNGMVEESTPDKACEPAVEHQGSDAKGKGKEVATYTEEEGDSTVDDPTPSLDAADDAPLKGPLMIRNMPAKDELFFAALNEKLEPISKGLDSLPTVMQGSGTEDSASLSEVPHQAADAKVAIDGEDETSKQTQEKTPPDVEIMREGDLESDFQLKFKNTSNFGAPFGVV